MTSQPTKRFLALLVSGVLLASLAVATVASPASAAAPKCQGFKATIVGTKKADVIRGTAKRDIIVAKGGNDRIYGKGGNDIICAGGGNDRVFGGQGIDRLWGQTGHDTLVGNAGPDFLAGQVGNDTLNGGIGVDTCFQGTGSGPVTRCERPDPLPPPPPSGPSLHSLTGILAVAYSDIDGLDGYSTGDVMIAQLEDTNGDKAPSFGDTVRMGRYPLDLNAGSFGGWQDTSHVVTIDFYSMGTLSVAHTDSASYHMWQRDAQRESYTETDGNVSRVQDGFAAVDDRIDMVADSPSVPQTMLTTSTSRPSDDTFIDVILNY